MYEKMCLYILCMYISVFFEFDCMVFWFVYLLFMYGDYDFWCNFYFDNVQIVLIFLVYNYEDSDIFDMILLKLIDL